MIISEPKVRLHNGNCMALNAFHVLIKGGQTHAIDCLQTIECDRAKCIWFLRANDHNTCTELMQVN